MDNRRYDNPRALSNIHQVQRQSPEERALNEKAVKEQIESMEIKASFISTKERELLIAVFQNDFMKKIVTLDNTCLQDAGLKNSRVYFMRLLKLLELAYPDSPLLISVFFVATVCPSSNRLDESKSQLEEYCGGDENMKREINKACGFIRRYTVRLVSDVTDSTKQIPYNNILSSNPTIAAKMYILVTAEMRVSVEDLLKKTWAAQLNLSRTMQGVQAAYERMFWESTVIGGGERYEPGFHAKFYGNKATDAYVLPSLEADAFAAAKNRGYEEVDLVAWIIVNLLAKAVKLLDASPSSSDMLKAFFNVVGPSTMERICLFDGDEEKHALKVKKITPEVLSHPEFTRTLSSTFNNELLVANSYERGEHEEVMKNLFDALSLNNLVEIEFFLEQIYSLLEMADRFKAAKGAREGGGQSSGPGYHSGDGGGSNDGGDGGGEPDGDGGSKGAPHPINPADGGRDESKEGAPEGGLGRDGDDSDGEGEENVNDSEPESVDEPSATGGPTTDSEKKKNVKVTLTGMRPKQGPPTTASPKKDGR